MELFGFQITKTKSEEKSKDQEKTFVPPSYDDGAIEVAPGGSYGTFVDLEGQAKTEGDLVTRYREMALQPECEIAIDDIINESIIMGDNASPVNIDLDKVSQPSSVKKRITQEFEHVLSLLNFGNKGYDIFRRWYVDGRLYHHIIINHENPRDGIKELRYVDPRKIRKVREPVNTKDQRTGITLHQDHKEYYIYNSKGMVGNNNKGIKIAVDSISHVTSGLVDSNNKMVLSYLHKAMKPLNQLRMLEDAVVIYRLSRAPERRIFYIDVGNLPKAKAEQYLRDMMVKHKNKLVYDANTGEVRDDRKFMTMMEDYWLPRREGGKGTEISTLPGGCLAMDTKVSLLDGRELSISDIELEMKNGKTLWTYSVDPETGKILPGLISWAGVTQKSAKVMKLTLDNGEEIICTPDHKFPVYGKGFLRADELQENESMMPLYRKKENISKHKKLDYEQFFDNESKEWKYTHRVVSDSLKDIVVNPYIYESEKENLYEVRHHKDFNRFNNDPSNLCFMSWRDHSKLHTDFGFSSEDFKRGCEAAKERLSYLKEFDKEQYDFECEQRSRSSKQWWESLSEEEYKEHVSKISEGAREHISFLNEEERTTRDAQSKKNFLKGTVALQTRLREDKEFNEWFREQIKKGWTEDARALASERSIKNNNEIIWGKNREINLAKSKERQRIEYSYEMLNFIIDCVKGKTTHQVTLDLVVELINKNDYLVNQLTELNENKKVPNWKCENKFTKNMVRAIPTRFGYDSWIDFRKKESLHNHRVVKIEWLSEKNEVGTLTIDNDEIYHNYHTFALSCGIFTKNSNLGEMEDVEYFRRKLYRALNVPISRIDSENQFSLGRASEVTRDEIKFSKFISRLRSNFSSLFDGLLEIQLVLTGVIKRSEWPAIRNKIVYDFIEDNHFQELKTQEILTERIRLVNDIEPLIGSYYSARWVRKNILQMTDDELEIMDKEIVAEREAAGESEDGVDDISNVPVGPVDYSSVDEEESKQIEAFNPSHNISEEEKKLVESMTRFMDSLADGSDEDEDE